MSREIIKNKTKLQSKTNTYKSELGQLYIDETDRKLLKILNWDARLSYRELARQTNLSTGTVITRLNKLRKSGVIKGYYVNIDPKKLGFELSAIIEVVAPKLSLMHAMEDIKEMSNVQGIYHSTGDVDVIIISKFKSVEDLQKFLAGLYNKLDIQRTQTRIVLNTVKEDFRVIV